MKKITDDKFDWAVDRLLSIMENNCPSVYGFTDTYEGSDCYRGICRHCLKTAIVKHLESGDARNEKK